MIDLDKVIPRTQQERIAIETLRLLRDISDNVSKILQQKDNKNETPQNNETIVDKPKKKTKRGDK